MPIFSSIPSTSELPISSKKRSGTRASSRSTTATTLTSLRPVIAETLPAGWESRLHPVPGYDNVFALDPYDLAIVN
ncbi:MAG: hypothetical protein FJ398_09420 [Verrucomicrobia bacterium]|nr:hypothetical protein [Verrucomicrobiota bacterium]